MCRCNRLNSLVSQLFFAPTPWHDAGSGDRNLDDLRVYRPKLLEHLETVEIMPSVLSWLAHGSEN